ncbi:MAG: hypothetical protein KAF91_19875 [Nostoc sp. TH1S01]|nr:hypothetical protein [Nostoc sp. TH1S01]
MVSLFPPRCTSSGILNLNSELGIGNTPHLQFMLSLGIKKASDPQVLAKIGDIILQACQLGT